MFKSSVNKSSYVKQCWQFLSDYFLTSKNKWQACALLFGCITLTLATIGLGFLIGWWFFPFIYAAFIAQNTMMFLIAVGSGLLIAGTMALFHYAVHALKNTLYVNWREWLYKKTIDQYLNNDTNYLTISRMNEKTLDNPEQRIQEDIDKVVESFLDLTLGFIRHALNLVIYVILLSLMGGSLSIMLASGPLIIPGFLVFIALGAGILTSLIGYAINRSLRALTNQETIAKANLRTDLQQVSLSAEEIEIERGGPYFQQRLERRVDEFSLSTAQQLSIKNKTSTFNLFNSFLQNIIPLCAAAPLYFNNLMTLDVFSTTTYYFSMITSSLNWFIDAFETINKFKTSLSRIIALHEVLAAKKIHGTTSVIKHLIGNDFDNVVVKNLTLIMPDSDKLLMKGFNLEFTKGFNTLIQAESGTGKSSIFKAIAGTWLSGEGEITIPKSLDTLYFLPQKPTMPKDTLRQVLGYPDATCPYTDEKLITALQQVNLGYLANSLEAPLGFKSLGEQQRIAFARVLLREPTWVFLDEATASLDETVENLVYHRLKELLPDTTIVSIAHRSTVKPHHPNVLFLRKNSQQIIEVTQEQVRQQQPSTTNI
jgi:putative ATP-binding cassette transporter